MAEDVKEEPVAGIRAQMNKMASDLGLGKLGDKPLTMREGEELLPRIITGVQAGTEGMDWFITRTNKEHAEAFIWAMDDEDAEIIARFIILVGRKNAVTAMAIRGVTQAVGLLEIGKITLPRFYQTYVFYARHGGFGY